MRVELLQWPENKPPGFLMIDDVGNLVVQNRPEGDWGPAGLTWQFLLRQYKAQVPGLKIVLFACSRNFTNSPLSHEIHIDRDRKRFVSWLAGLASLDWVEIALHGEDHLIGGVPECVGIEEPRRWLIRAKRELEHIAGTRIVGGKCPAYAGFTKIEPHLADAGFSWWADHWTPVKGSWGFAFPRSARLKGGRAPTQGEKGLVLIPSNLAVPSSFIKNRNISWLNKRILRNRVMFALQRGFPISLQTHYAKIRPDGTTQIYNLYDDLLGLLFIMKLIEQHGQWMLPRDIVKFLRTRDSLKIIKEHNGFYLECDEPQWNISLKITPSPAALRDPKGQELVPTNGVFTFFPQKGFYEFLPKAGPR